MNTSSNNSLSLTAGQIQHLTAKQLQTVELLALPRQDMEALLAANPLIEITENDTEELFSSDAPASAVETEDESLYEAQIYEDSGDLDDYVSAEEMEGLEEYAPADDEET